MTLDRYRSLSMLAAATLLSACGLSPLPPLPEARINGVQAQAVSYTWPGPSEGAITTADGDVGPDNPQLGAGPYRLEISTQPQRIEVMVLVRSGGDRANLS